MRQQFEKRPSAELVDILRGHDSHEWRGEVFPLVEEILRDRGVDVAGERARNPASEAMRQDATLVEIAAFATLDDSAGCQSALARAGFNVVGEQQFLLQVDPALPSTPGRYRLGVPASQANEAGALLATLDKSKRLPYDPARLKPALGRSLTTAFLLFSEFLVSFVMTVVLAQRLFLLARLVRGGPVSMAALRDGDVWVARATVLEGALTLATAVAFLLWLYRMYQNLIVLRDGVVEFTPGQAVGSFFVPILNLYVPYTAVRELLVRSDPALPPGGAADSAVTGGSRLVLWWWVFFVARQLPTWWILSLRQARNPALDQLTYVSYGLLAAHLLAMPAALLAVAVVYLVSQRQDELAEATERGGMARPSEASDPNDSPNAPDAL